MQADCAEESADVNRGEQIRQIRPTKGGGTFRCAVSNIRLENKSVFLHYGAFAVACSSESDEQARFSFPTFDFEFNIENF